MTVAMFHMGRNTPRASTSTMAPMTTIRIGSMALDRRLIIVIDFPRVEIADFQQHGVHRSGFLTDGQHLKHQRR